MRALAVLGDRLLWPVYARLYDALRDVYAYQDMLAAVVDVADARGCRVLDAGSGTGNLAERLLRDGAGHVLAVDASGPMLRRAARKLAGAVAEGRAEVVRDDLVSRMSVLPPASVDRITVVNVLYTLPARDEFFRAARRVLRPGGHLVVSHTTRSGSGPIVREQVRRGGLRSLLRPRVLGLVVADAVIDLIARGGRYHFVPVATVTAEAAAAGLGAVVSHGRTYGGAADGVNELLRIARD